MRTRARKWGNSLALRLPKVVAKSLSIEEGTELELEEREDGILLRPVRSRYELGKLLKEIRKENLPEPQDFGTPEGKEAW
jgi:antitoxin MazE